jgi:hypothetical protein
LPGERFNLFKQAHVRFKYLDDFGDEKVKDNAENPGEQLVFAPVIIMQERLVDAGPVGDLLHCRSVVALHDKDLRGSLQYPFFRLGGFHIVLTFWFNQKV